MGQPAYKISQRFTWTDYQKWPDDERWEIIGGEAFAMSPAPMTRHQRIQSALLSLMFLKFRKGSCEVMGAPTDVKLSDEDIVQPDILVVCDKTQITRTHIEGPPKLVVEVLSPSSTTHDRARKSRLYAAAGITEYWIVTPHPATIEVLVLDGDSYRLRHVFTADDTLTSPTFPKLKIRLKDVFNFPLEPGEEVPVVVREPPARYDARKKSPVA